jgi:hypothetical protein
MILELVRAYQANGNDALGHYDDGDASLVVTEEFRDLLANGDLLPTPVPALIAYLKDYPRGRPPGPRTSSTGRSSILDSSLRSGQAM